MYLLGQGRQFATPLSAAPGGGGIVTPLPLLFILFINGPSDCLKSSVKIFADDLKLIANLSDWTVRENKVRETKV